MTQEKQHAVQWLKGGAPTVRSADSPSLATAVFSSALLSSFHRSL